MIFSNVSLLFDANDNTANTDTKIPPQTKSKPGMPPLYRIFVPNRGPTIHAREYSQCSTPITVPYMFPGTIFVVMVVILVKRLYWKMARNKAKLMNIYCLIGPSSGIKDNCFENRTDSTR